MLFSPLVKLLPLLSCLIVASSAAPASNGTTTPSKDTVSKDSRMPTSKPLGTCVYSTMDRTGPLEEWAQEDEIITGDPLTRMNEEFFQGPYGVEVQWLVATDNNQLTLESNVFEDKRLRLVEITTMVDKITRVYLADWSKCTASLQGNLPTNKKPVMKAVRVLTLKAKQWKING